MMLSVIVSSSMKRMRELRRRMLLTLVLFAVAHSVTSAMINHPAPVLALPPASSTAMFPTAQSDPGVTQHLLTSHSRLRPGKAPWTGVPAREATHRLMPHSEIRRRSESTVNRNSLTQSDYNSDGSTAGDGNASAMPQQQQHRIPATPGTKRRGRPKKPKSNQFKPASRHRTRYLVTEFATQPNAERVFSAAELAVWARVADGRNAYQRSWRQKKAFEDHGLAAPPAVLDAWRAGKARLQEYDAAGREIAARLGQLDDKARRHASAAWARVVERWRLLSADAADSSDDGRDASGSTAISKDGADTAPEQDGSGQVALLGREGEARHELSGGLDANMDNHGPIATPKPDAKPTSSGGLPRTLFSSLLPNQGTTSGSPTRFLHSGIRPGDRPWQADLRATVAASVRAAGRMSTAETSRRARSVAHGPLRLPGYHPDGLWFARPRGPPRL